MAFCYSIAMPIQPGTSLGPYQITALLGAGGMGEVYRAKDTRLDRTVAIKVLPAHLSANSDLQRRFEQEAQAVSGLNHPHICSLYDIGEQSGTHYLVMEYMEGETLRSRLDAGGLSVRKAIDFAVQIASALSVALPLFAVEATKRTLSVAWPGGKVLAYSVATASGRTPTPPTDAS